jgi:hypothetical protein
MPGGVRLAGLARRDDYRAATEPLVPRDQHHPAIRRIDYALVFADRLPVRVEHLSGLHHVPSSPTCCVEISSKTL